MQKLNTSKVRKKYFCMYTTHLTFHNSQLTAIREPQNMFHGLVPAEILKQYCDQHSIKEFIIPDIMTYDHPHRERSERVILQR